MLNLSDKMLEELAERFKSARMPYAILDYRDIKMLKEFAGRYGISRLPAVLPDCISINMTRQKSPSWNRIMKITAEHYVAVPDRQLKITDSGARGRKRGPYITKKTAGETDGVPACLPVITNGEYRDALAFNCNGSAYLQMLSDSSGLRYKNGSSSFRGLAATYEKIKGLFTDEGIKEVHLPLLAALYGILLQKFSSSPESLGPDGEAVFYYPDLAKRTGKAHPGAKDIGAVTSAMDRLGNVVGIVDNGRKGSDILPVLSAHEYDKNTNTVRFASPYMARVINEIDRARIRKGKDGRPAMNKNGKVRTLPAYSYLVDISIEKERDKKAVEIVMIIVTLIEQAGSKGTPHIKAGTVIERSSLLKKSLQGPSTQKKDTVLRRSFSKAWELLRTKTKLSSVYRDIRLPDPENPHCIPTCTSLGMVFRFPHKGKCQDI